MLCRAISIILLSVSLALGLPSCSNEEPEKIPINVVFISIDNLGADHMGCYGYARNTTPFIDSLAEEGTLFERISAQETWTLPSHASMLSSRYVSAHGVCKIHSRLAKDSLNLLQESFQEGRYLTAAFTSCAFLTSVYGFDRGFDHFLSGNYPANKINSEVLDYISTRIFEPFFLFIHYYDVHTPFIEKNPYGEDFVADVPPGERNFVKELNRLQKFIGRKVSELTQEEILWIEDNFPSSKTTGFLRYKKYQSLEITETDVWNMIPIYLREGNLNEMDFVRGCYDNGIAFTDKHLYELFKGLERFPWYERTLFVITSDHGEAFNQHSGVIGHGDLPYAELVRVPLILRGPGIPPGKKLPLPAASIDIAPTLLDLAGLPIPSSFQGQSLVPWLRGKETVERDPILSGSLEAKRLSIEDGRWKLMIQNKKNKKTWLFDLLSPEGEFQDVAATYPDRVRQLEQTMMRGEERNRTIGSEIKGIKLNLDDETRARLKELGYLK